jgi:integrase
MAQMPDFPEVSFELSYRNTVDKDTQMAIVAEVYRLTYDLNPRILGIQWLCTYVNLRPWELINIKESHIDLKQGRILIPHPKEKAPKYIFMIDEDIEILHSMPRGFPEMFFFRHLKGNGAAKPGQQFGKDYLYKWWKKPVPT